MAADKPRPLLQNSLVGKETEILRIYTYFTYPLTNLKYLDTLGILSLVFPCYDQFGFGGSNEPLYTSKDVGITLVDHSNFKNIILESDTAWMVEFYSSWCGHCIRFAPVFKELGTNVEGKFNVYVVRLQAYLCRILGQWDILLLNFTSIGFTNFV